MFQFTFIILLGYVLVFLMFRYGKGNTYLKTGYIDVENFIYWVRSPLLPILFGFFMGSLVPFLYIMFSWYTAVISTWLIVGLMLWLIISGKLDPIAIRLGLWIWNIGNTSR